MIVKYFSESFLDIDDNDFIASGSERDCYVYPGNGKFCIKVSHARDRDKHQNNNDYKYYSILSKRLSDWSRVSMCHGWVMTSKGKGLVFDLVKNIDGSPAIMLDEYIKKHGVTVEVLKELEKLKEYLIKNNIMVCDLRDRNIACRIGRDGLFLKLIDGVGNRDYIKICDWWRFLGKKKIERHWKKLESSMTG